MHEPPGVSPTVSSPMSSVVGRRPKAASTSSASSARAVVERDPRRRRFGRRARPRRRAGSRPRPRAARGDLLARERLLALDQPLAAVDERHRASRAPTTPAPSRPRRRRRRAWRAAAGRRRGRRLDVRPRARLGQPWIGGTAGSRAGCHHDGPARHRAPRPPTRTRRSPSSRPRPRTSVTPRCSSQGTCPESSRFAITSSRRASTAARSSSPDVDARHAPRLVEQLDRP